jgi:hypothetical protein
MECASCEVRTGLQVLLQVASISQLTVNRLSRQCGILNISQPHRSPRPVTGIAVLLHVTKKENLKFLNGTIFELARVRRRYFTWNYIYFSVVKFDSWYFLWIMYNFLNNLSFLIFWDWKCLQCEKTLKGTLLSCVKFEVQKSVCYEE